MGVRILSVDGNDQTCLFDSVTGFAFGPVAEEDTLMEFLKWCEEVEVADLRALAPDMLERVWNEFLSTTKVSHEELHMVPEEG